MVSLTKVLKTCALALVCGLLSAQAAPVVFTGQIDIPHPARERRASRADHLFAALGAKCVDNIPQTNQWIFSFMQDVLGSSYSLDFSQAIEKEPASISFD